MSNVKTTAAAEGWMIYSRSPLPPAMDELNAELLAFGNSAISLRMYRHYRALRRHGRSEYLPINELDIQVKHQRPRRAR